MILPSVATPPTASPSESSPASGPIGGAERHLLVDALRGIALLGIAIVNMELFAATLDEGWRSDLTGAADRAAYWTIIAFAQAKFYLLFSLLFGYGLAIALRRAGGLGGLATARYRRRMIGLIALGLAHAVLLFAGDILLSYGVLGLALFLFRAIPSRQLLVGAAISYGAGMVAIALIGLAAAVGDAGDLARDPRAVEAAYAAGSFADGVDQRLADLAVILPGIVLVQWPSAFAMFLVGVAVGRTRLLAEPGRYPRLLRRGLVTLAPIGLAGGILAATLQSLEPDGAGAAYGLGLIVQFATAPALTLTYVCALALWLEPVMRSRPVAIARAAGRMSLSVYVGESVVAAILFSGWGLGLFGTVGPAAGVALAAAIWLGLALASAAWLRTFRFGPLEWALRSATYGRMQPMRPAAEAGITNR